MEPLVSGLFALCGLLFFRIAYQWFLGSLSSIPGPRITAVTNLWRYYHEIKGDLPWTLMKLREKYSQPPLIRVGPNTVVVQDATQYEVIYRVGSKFLKDAEFYHSFPSASSGRTITTATDKGWHHTRRKAIMGNLSKQRVTGLQPLVNAKLSELVSRVEDISKANKPVDVFAGLRCMTLDIISEYAFGQCLNSLHDSRLHHQMLDTMEQALAGFYIHLRLPNPVKWLMNQKFVAPFVPAAREMLEFKKWSMSCVENFQPTADRQYLFDALLGPHKNCNDSEMISVQGEAEDILIAGSDTTATTLTCGIVHLARNPDMWERLYQSIAPIYGDADQIPAAKVLEDVSLLTATIKESLRLAAPVPCYLWRVVPAEGYTINYNGQDHRLASGTVVGMSSISMHYDPDIFPDPDTFNPSRWFGPNNGCGGPNGDLDKFLVPFSKGTRQCAGINLAWMEMYLTIAMLVMRFRISGEAVPGRAMKQKEYFVGMLQEHQYYIKFELRV